ncbi:MAG TPA: hypothetical protein VGY56_10495 [Verrucomicrobiae bacterium]|nr:hypothetical protein [Verrucomicrobiae bacterium]
MSARWTKRPDLYPGWKMTPAQHNSYWRLLNQAWRSYGKDSIAFEDFRALIHARAFGRNISAKDIDRMDGYDAFKKAVMAIIQPSNLNAQVALENMPKTRLIHRICNDFPASYILCLMNSPRFARCRQNEQRASLEDLQRWSEKDLTDLRTTLCARNPEPAPAPARPAEEQDQSPIVDAGAEEEAWWEQESQKEMDAEERGAFNP